MLFDREGECRQEGEREMLKCDSNRSSLVRDQDPSIHGDDLWGVLEYIGNRLFLLMFASILPDQKSNTHTYERLAHRLAVLWVLRLQRSLTFNRFLEDYWNLICYLWHKSEDGEYEGGTTHCNITYYRWGRKVWLFSNKCSKRYAVGARPKTKFKAKLLVFHYSKLTDMIKS